MKLDLKNQLIGTTSKKDKVLQIQRKINEIINHHMLGQAVSLTEFHKSRNKNELANINLELSKTWAIQSYRIQKILK